MGHQKKEAKYPRKSWEALAWRSLHGRRKKKEIKKAENSDDKHLEEHVPHLRSRRKDVTAWPALAASTHARGI